VDAQGFATKATVEAARAEAARDLASLRAMMDETKASVRAALDTAATQAEAKHATALAAQQVRAILVCYSRCFLSDRSLTDNRLCI